MILAACGRVGFGAGDRVSDAPPAIDTPAGGPPCLSDSFDSNAIDAARWTAFGASSVQDQMQQLVITLVPNAPMPAYYGITSNAKYDLTNGQIAVELVTPPAPVFGPEAILDVFVDAMNDYLITDSSGNLVIRERLAGVDDRVVLPYDPAADRHWRVRHDPANARVVFETSADGAVTRVTMTSVPIRGAGWIEARA